MVPINFPFVPDAQHSGFRSNFLNPRPKHLPKNSIRRAPRGIVSPAWPLSWGGARMETNELLQCTGKERRFFQVTVPAKMFRNWWFSSHPETSGSKHSPWNEKIKNQWWFSNTKNLAIFLRGNYAVFIRNWKTATPGVGPDEGMGRDGAIPIVLLINMNWSVICKTWVKLDLLGYLCILRKVFWFQSPFSVLDSHHLWIELQKWYGLRFAGNLGCQWKEWRFRREHFYQMKKRVVSPFGVDVFFGLLMKNNFWSDIRIIIYLWCMHELEVFSTATSLKRSAPPQREKQKCRPSSKVDWKRAYSSVTGSGLSFQKRSQPICSRLTHKKHGPMDGEKIMDAMRVLEKTKTCTPQKFNMEADHDCFQ